MFKIAGLFMLIVFPGLLFADASQVRYCETAFAENGQWAYPDKESLIKGLIDETEKTAVEQFFANELNEFEYTVLKKDQIVEGLREFLEYSGYEVFAEKPLNFCMTLDGARVDESAGNRFKPVQIAKICNLNREFIEKQIDRIKSTFVSSLTERNKPESVQSMLKKPDNIENIKNTNTMEFMKYVHEIETGPASDAVSGTTCISLIIYPIELYTGLLK